MQKITNIEKSIKTQFILEMKLGSKERIHNSDKDIVRLEPSYKQGISEKPQGLWYGFGDSWIKWVEKNQPDWKFKNYFKVKLNPKTILVITNPKEFDEFEEKYGESKKINWEKVADDYDGIEINPYISQRTSSSWYWGWDIASGCIWGKTALKDIKKINLD